MAKTISLTNIVIHAVNINYTSQSVSVNFGLADANGVEWETDTAIFFVTLPPQPTDPQGGLLPYPPEWFTIPPAYITTLVNMRNDIVAALQSKFLV